MTQTAIRHNGTDSQVWKLFLAKVVSDVIKINTPSKNRNDPNNYFKKTIIAYVSVGCTVGNGAVSLSLKAHAINVPAKAAMY